MGTSYFSNAEYLYSYIEANDTAKATELIKVLHFLMCRTIPSCLISN
jgi:hypothetical protein